MNWNKWFYQAMIGHAPLTAQVPPEHILPGGSLKTSPTFDKFIVVRWLPVVPGPWQGVEVVRSEIWIHHRAGSYSWINSVAQILRDFVPTLLPTSDDDLVGEPRWEGISQELTDDALSTLTRNVSVRFSGKV